MAGSRRRRPGGPRRWAWWLVGAAVAVVVLALGGTFFYFHVISGPAPAPLSLKHGSGPTSSGTAGNAAAASVAGTWKVTAGSVVGYRVKEVLFGQHHTAVGRTSAITGHVTISGTTVTAAGFTAAMATIKSDESERDVQFRGRIMDTAAYPTGTLTLTKPIALGTRGELPVVGVVRTYTATANLTLHGQTRPVTFPLSAERTSSEIEVQGSIPILFSRWDIPDPSFTGFVTTQDHGVLEFLLRLARS